MSMYTRKPTGLEAEVEGEICEMISRDVVETRRQRANDDKMVADVSLLLRRVSVNSVQEIDGLISDLQTLRDRLHDDGERMAREIVDYASLSHTAMQSTKFIAENLTNRSEFALARFNGWDQPPSLPAASKR